MASRKHILFAVFIVLQLILPGTSAFFKKLLDLAEDIVQDASNLVLNCDVPQQECPNSNITFWLYTRDTQDSPQKLDPSNPKTILEAKFAQGVPLKVIFHGYTGYRDYSPNMELRPAYFTHGEYNIITVDWNPLGLSPCYIQAVANVELVSVCSARFLDSLFETRAEVDISNTHIIGFSLGAHIAGVTAANLQTGKVPRVTGFDPAGPLFVSPIKQREEMINSDVADFVDIYHSNMGVKGQEDPSGVVDVYLNNGAHQPGCNCNSSCDHVRSVEYFAEAINSPTGLWGFLCDSFNSYKKGDCSVTSEDKLVVLGDAISSTESGVFLALTNNASLYLLDPSVYVKGENLAEKVDQSCSVIESWF